MTIMGTRPEVIRLSRILPLFDEHFEHIVVHTGQNHDHELNGIFFQELGLRPPDCQLTCAAGHAAETIARVISDTDRVLAEHQPDALLVLGDTNSGLSALAAKRRKVPVFHMEAGNRCHDQRVPEEINRRVIDHIADINLTYSALARENLLREGLPADRVIKTGSPLYEVLSHYRPRIEASNVLERMGLQADGYFVVSAHREENVDAPDTLARLVHLIDAVAEEHQIPVIFSTHPRTRQRLQAAGLTFHPLVRTMKPLGFFDYVKLQLHSRAVLSDSGSISEESSILNFPALNLREVHERPEAMEEAAVMMVGLNLDRVRQGLAVLSRQPRGQQRPH